jgi:hypothetical protein
VKTLWSPRKTEIDRLYVPSRTSRAGGVSVIPFEKKLFCQWASVVCNDLVWFREICPNPTLCGSNSTISALLADETVLRTYHIQTKFNALKTVLRPAQECFTHMETSPLPVKGCKISACSSLRAFEQGGIFIVPHLLRNGTSVFLVSSEGPPHSVASYDILTQILTGLHYRYMKQSQHVV